MKKKKLWLIPVIAIPVLIIIVVIIGIIIANMTSKMKGSFVQLIPVETQDLSEVITLKGTLSGETKTNVTSKASAQVVDLKVQVGDTVKKGDILCVLDSKKIGERLDQANNTLNNSNALSNNQNQQQYTSLTQAKEDQTRSLQECQEGIDKAQSAYNTAENNVNNNNSKLSSNQSKLKKLKSAMESAKADLDKAMAEDPVDQAKVSAAQTAYDNALAEYNAQNDITNPTSYASVIAECKAKGSAYAEVRDAALATLDAAKKRYEETKITTDRQIAGIQNSINIQKYQSENSALSDTVKELEESYGDCVVYAPMDGIVTAVTVSLGDNYIAGTTMVTIEDNKNMKLVLNVDEKNIIKLNEGMTAIVSNDYMSGSEIEGQITRVVKVKSAAPASLGGESLGGGYYAEISFENTCDFLLGMSAKAKVYLDKREPSVSVPYDCVQTDEDGKTYVMVAKDNGNGTYTAKKVYFEAGEEIEYFVEVKDDSIKEGDQLINSFGIREGETFTPNLDYLNAIDVKSAGGAMVE